MDKTNNNIGILDPLGQNLNPLNDKPYSDDYKKLANIWSKFPGYQKASNIINAIKQYQVLLIVADTGSGKTVLVPKYVLHTFNYGKNGKKIGITLPKQIVAKSAAEFAAKTLDVELGKQVGYQYKGSPKNANSDETVLLYATDGTIKSRLLNDPELKGFDCVIIDEAHERKIQIDFLLYLLKETLKLRPEFKLIIMSATINASIFESYFSEFSFKEINLVGQRTFPIESIFLKEPLEYSYVIDTGFNIMIKIMETDNPSNAAVGHDILFFVTSSNEAMDLCKRLQHYIKHKCIGTDLNIICNGDTFCVEVYSGMDPYRQSLAQDKNMYKDNKQYNYVRKVVIATNVAESSLTIDGIKYVIDSGYELKSSYDPIKRAKKLDRQLITLAQAKQRMGRCGRTEPGICYHLYTKNDFDNIMEKFPEPDIRVSDISGDCLSLLNLERINTVPNLINTLMQFIEPPKELYIKDAITILMQLGLIQEEKITGLGKYVVNIGGNIMSSLSIIYSKLYQCSSEMAKIISMIELCNNNIVNFFSTPKSILKSDTDDEKYKKMLESLTTKYDKARNKFKHKYGDHLSLLKLYTKFYEVYKKHKNNDEQLRKWCYDKFLKLNLLLKVVERVRKIKRQLYSVNIDENSLNIIKEDSILNMDIDERVLHCLMTSYRINIANKISGDKYDNYTTLRDTNTKIGIDQNSFIQLNNVLPKTVFYNELFISMGKANLNIVSNYIHK